MKKLLFGLLSLTWAMGLAISLPVPAPVHAMSGDDLWGENVFNEYNNSGFSTADPRKTVANLIKVGLGFLGTIAVVLVIFAGFKWMTAAGSQEKIDEAKKLMSAAVVGLLIILLAFALTNFVINAVIGAI